MSLLSETPISNERRDFLRRSQCGTDAGKPLVCCPTTFTVDDIENADKQCGVQVSDKIVGGTFFYYILNANLLWLPMVLHTYDLLHTYTDSFVSCTVII